MPNWVNQADPQGFEQDQAIFAGISAAPSSSEGADHRRYPHEDQGQDPDAGNEGYRHRLLGPLLPENDG